MTPLLDAGLNQQLRPILHQMNNKLTNLMGLVAVLQEQVPSSAMELLAAIDRNVESLAGLVQDLQALGQESPTEPGG